MCAEPVTNSQSTGLRAWRRDAELPALAGDAAVGPMEPERAADLAAEHLWAGVQPPAAGASVSTAVTWEYARWKPGVSTTCAYGIGRGPDRHTLVVKCYAGAKASSLAERKRSGGGQQPGRWVSLPERRTVLWTREADRELAQHHLEPRRLANFLAAAELVAPRAVRRRRTRCELLRYKPERRAVYRLDLSLRDGERPRLQLAARVLPTAVAARTLEARAAFEVCGGADVAVTVAAGHARHGVVLEPWLALTTGAPTDFRGANTAGALLARLHALPCPGEAAGPMAIEAEPLFAWNPELVAAAEGAARSIEASAGTGRTGSAGSTWVHGDFHPDQVAHSGSGALLLDLDCLRIGDPLEDLASWIADHLHERPELSWTEASEALTGAYEEAGGAGVRSGWIRALVHLTQGALVQRAAASLRRLELGAVERALRSLRTAQSLRRTAQSLRP